MKIGPDIYIVSNYFHTHQFVFTKLYTLVKRQMRRVGLNIHAVTS